ncbi:MAG: LysE family translocator [Ectothiorhodospiraceae bacterium]|nr:LysE family translocator [Ectothiorhodospiraceae bacterium]
MSLTITLPSMAALAAAMIVLASVPSVSVLMVTARSAAGGLRHGMAAIAGVVLGDLLFLLIALLGLSFLAAAMGEWFSLLKYVGGAYLVWFGFTLLRARPVSAESTGAGNPSSLGASFLTGLLITLADQKAILFYLGFLPVFVDLASATWLDVMAISGIIVLSVGGVKLLYAYLAHSASRLIGHRLGRGINVTAGGAMIGVGIYLFTRS